jgi:hypothetical protein
MSRVGWRPRPHPGRLVFGFALAGYLAAATYLVFGVHVVIGDALSRVANAQYVLFSRDPHLAAIGFVWNPLPSLVELVMLPFRGLWPALTQDGFAANLMSALFMAGAVYQLLRLMEDIRVPVLPRAILLAGFALHPMIVFYGANGMSEAPLIFFLLMALRYLIRWLMTSDERPLVIQGLALAAAYLTRYEAAIAGLATIALVALVSYVRAPNRERRLTTVACDALLAGTPIVVTMGVWHVASWVITGSPFQQVASVYGNTSQLGTLVSQGVVKSPSSIQFGQTAAGVAALELTLPLLVAAGVWTATTRRDIRQLAVAAVLGSVLSALLLAYATGRVLPWLRYLIVCVPLAVMVSALAVTAVMGPTGASRHRRVRGLALALLTAVALPVSAIALLDPRVNQMDALALRAAFAIDPGSAGVRSITHRFDGDHTMAAYLDGLHLARGSVLADAFSAYAVITASNDPVQFVTTPDRDFLLSLRDPVGSGIRYLLVPEPSGLTALDALNRTYPHLYRDGANFAELVGELSPTADGPAWRLYRVRPAP